MAAAGTACKAEPGGHHRLVATDNEDQIAYWNGPAGGKWVELYERIDAQIAPLGAAAIDRLAPAPGERILDLGCGCGTTTLALAARVGPTGTVTGVDVSRPMLARAEERARARDVRNVGFVAADAATHAFVPASADAMFSRFGVMFFADPASAFGNVRRALVPNGRLGFLCWQSLGANEWVRAPLEAAAPLVPLPPPPPPGTPGPFQLADRDRIQSILDEAGWTDVAIDPLEGELGIGGSAELDEAVDFLLRIGPLARVLGEIRDRADLRHAVADALRERLARALGPEGVRLGAAAWLVSARAPA
jgi:SAM-dependent methyltransferase